MEEIKVFTAFSGYDSQCLALDRIKRDYSDFDYELVGWSEIDKYAIQAHNAVYPQWAARNYGDISKIEWEKVPNFDLLTYSFPCQDISVAGQQRGFAEGSETRSSLLWECRKAIIAKKPKYLLMENVKALVGKKFFPILKDWMRELQEYGYKNFIKVLDAKDFGVPQHRERVFMISILAEDAAYEFSKSFPLKKRLNDILEKDVLEKYYLSADKTGLLFYKGNFIIEQENEIIQVGNIMNDANRKFKNPQCGRVYHPYGIAPTLNTCQGGGREPKIIETDRTISRIRKLTPRECFRLMGVDEADIDKIQAAGLSNAQQYKMAGNSIVVDVLYYIIRNLFCAIADDKKEDIQLQLF